MIYEFHIFKPRNAEINEEKIIAVKDATQCSCEKKALKNFRLVEIRTLTSAIPEMLNSTYKRRFQDFELGWATVVGGRGILTTSPPCACLPSI